MHDRFKLATQGLGAFSLTAIHATDVRTLPHQVEDVWKVLADVAAYPRWWPRFVGLSVRSYEPQILGSVLQLRPMGGRAFLCKVVSTERPHLMRMEYFGGFIEGTGEWRLTPTEAGTQVEYELDVTAKGWLVACLSKVIPLAAFHSWQMQGVLRNLEKAVVLAA